MTSGFEQNQRPDENARNVLKLRFRINHTKNDNWKTPVLEKAIRVRKLRSKKKRDAKTREISPQLVQLKKAILRQKGPRKQDVPNPFFL